MPTVAQVLQQQQPTTSPDRHLVLSVAAVSGRQATVTLPDGTTTQAAIPKGLTAAPGDTAFVVLARAANVVLALLEGPS